MSSLTINIETCKSDCFSCYQNYDTCTDCNDSNFTQIEDKTYECYPPTYLIVKYINFWKIRSEPPPTQTNNIK